MKVNVRCNFRIHGADPEELKMFKLMKEDMRHKLYLEKSKFNDDKWIEIRDEIKDNYIESEIEFNPELLFKHSFGTAFMMKSPIYYNLIEIGFTNEIITTTLLPAIEATLIAQHFGDVNEIKTIEIKIRNLRECYSFDVLYYDKENKLLEEE